MWASFRMTPYYFPLCISGIPLFLDYVAIGFSLMD